MTATGTWGHRFSGPAEVFAKEEKNSAGGNEGGLENEGSGIGNIALGTTLLPKGSPMPWNPRENLPCVKSELGVLPSPPGL